LQRVPLRAVAIVASSIIIVSVVTGIVTGVMSDGIVRPFALIALVLAAVALLGVGIVSFQSVVDELDESDPLATTQGGALGPTIRRMLRKARASAVRTAREWQAALRRNVTRESLARLARACADALSGVPPAEVSPPPSAGPLARPAGAPPRPKARERSTPSPTPRLRRAPDQRAAARRRHPSRRRRVPV